MIKGKILSYFGVFRWHFHHSSMTTAWMSVVIVVVFCLPAPCVFLTYRGETRTLEHESRGHRVHCVRSGSVTPRATDADLKLALLIKLAHLYFLLDCFEEQSLPVSGEVTASGLESNLERKSQRRNCSDVHCTWKWRNTSKQKAS